MSADLSTRLDLRRRARRRTRLRRILLAALAAAAAGVLVWLVLFSSVLETRQVTVEGTEILTAEQVSQTAQVPIGTRMARLPGGAIKQRVLALPAVAEVKLHRQWPNELVIRVTERTMVYQRADETGYQWVDAEGRIFHAEAERRPGVVAVVSGNDQRMLADVATVVQAMPSQVAEATEHVEATSIDNIVVLLADGRSIVWGNAEKSAQKAEVLPALLDMPGTVFDVSVPSHPAVS